MSQDMSSDTAQSQRTERILVVEDEPVNLHLLSKMLQGQGYDLRVASNGEEALSLVAQAAPDLILLDVNMPPGIDGYEVCRRLKQNPKTAEIAIVFLSGLCTGEEKVKGLKLGAVDYIGKPFNLTEVVTRVDTHLTIRRLRQSLAQRNRELELANQQMKRDLLLAERVQRAVLPTEAPQTPHAEFAWAYRPCDELAGDSLNVFAFDDRHVVMYVLDVTGHGVSAALLSFALTHTLAPRQNHPSILTRPIEAYPGYQVRSPAEVVGELNTLFPMNVEIGQYFTLCYALMDLLTGQVCFTCAGHPCPIHAPATGPVQFCQAKGLPVGVMDDVDYAQTQLQLEPGDRLYLHSDCLFEQRNYAGELFGHERVLDMVAGGRETTLQESVGQLEQQLLSWSESGLADDLSILAVQWHGPGQAAAD